MSALPPPSPFETPAEPPARRRHPGWEFIVDLLSEGVLWIGGFILVLLIGVVFFFAKGAASKGAPENDPFRGFFEDHRTTVCPVYVEAKNMLGLEVAENTALELLEDAYTGTWQEALSTEALRMLDSCGSSSNDQTTPAEQAPAANPPPSTTAAPVDTQPPAPEPTTTEPVEEPAVTASTTPTTATSLPRETFADLAAAADEVLGPLEMADGTRFAVFANHATNAAETDGSVILAVEGQNGWDVRQEILPEGSPSHVSAPGDLDGDGQAEIQMTWHFGRTNFGALYRLDTDGSKLIEVPFAEEMLPNPMGDWYVDSVDDGSVTTAIETCDPDCATGLDYVSWTYDPVTQRLIPSSQPESVREPLNPVTQPDLETVPPPTTDAATTTPPVRASGSTTSGRAE